MLLFKTGKQSYLKKWTTVEQNGKCTRRARSIKVQRYIPTWTNIQVSGSIEIEQICSEEAFSGQC